MERQDIKERTFRFAVRIVRLCERLDQMSGVWKLLGRQLLKAGTSIGANVEEAQAGQSRADFISKYNIALKEARESIYWLRLLSATCSLDFGLDDLIREASELSLIIGAIVTNSRKGARSK